MHQVEPKRAQRAHKGAPEPHKEQYRNSKMNKKKAAERPQSDDDLEQPDSKIDKTAAEWRGYHARSAQPGNKSGQGA